MATQSYSRPPYSPTRFPAGITNANDGETLGNMGQPDPTKFQTIFDDFNLGVGNWTVATTAAAAGQGGLLLMTGTTTPAVVQTPLASVGVLLGKRAFFKAKLALASATDTSIIFGLTDDADVPTNGIYVTVVNQTLVLTVGTTSTVAVAVTYTTNSVDLGIELRPNGDVLAYFNEEIVARTSDSAIVPENTAFLFGISSTTDNATLNYLLSVVERAPVA